MTRVLRPSPIEAFIILVASVKIQVLLVSLDCGLEPHHLASSPLRLAVHQGVWLCLVCLEDEVAFPDNSLKDCSCLFDWYHFVTRGRVWVVFSCMFPIHSILVAGVGLLSSMEGGTRLTNVLVSDWL